MVNPGIVQGLELPPTFQDRRAKEIMLREQQAQADERLATAAKLRQDMNDRRETYNAKMRISDALKGNPNITPEELVRVGGSYGLPIIEDYLKQHKQIIDQRKAQVEEAAKTATAIGDWAMSARKLPVERRIADRDAFVRNAMQSGAIDQETGQRLMEHGLTDSELDDMLSEYNQFGRAITQRQKEITDAEEFNLKHQQALEAAAKVTEAGKPKKIDEYTDEQQNRVLVFQKADGSVYKEVQGKQGAPPRTQVPGTDIPLPRDVEDQRRRIAQAGRTDNEPLVPVVGPDGKAIYAPRSQAAGQAVPSSSQNRPPSEGERTAFRFYERMKGATEDLAKVEDAISQKDTLGQAYLKYAPNVMQSEENQLYQQAQRAFTEARLRKDSGAAIPESEFENDRKTYFVQPGDKPATIEQKRRARATALEAIRKSAGRAYEETYGELPGKTGGKTLDEVTALEFLNKAGGDKAKARQAAKAAGYTWN